MALVVASGCAKCGASAKASTVDAGVAARPHQLRQIDLRSAMMVVFPEYRGAFVKQGSAALTRTVNGPLEKFAEAAFTKNQFTRSADGSAWLREPFVARVNAPTVAIEVPLDAPTVEKIFNAPNALSTLDLAMWLPKDAALETEREVFELTLTYETATEGRSAFLARQVVRLLLGNSQWTASPALGDAWDTDAGFPEVFEATLLEASTGASVWFHREGRTVRVRYTLLTNEPAR
ncbi:MAG: hypothetical protein JNG84_11790 [Archangium sp.]|nr:hypothetical protein [Archangium sp.]